MRPYPAARMGTAAARQASQVPTTFTSRQARRSATDSSSIVPRGQPRGRLLAALGRTARQHHRGPGPGEGASNREPARQAEPPVMTATSPDRGRGTADSSVMKKCWQNRLPACQPGAASF